MDQPPRALVRSTTIELGPLRIVREYHLAVAAVAPAPRRGGGWRTLAVAGLACAASAGGIAIASTRLPPAPYSVSLPVPERTPAVHAAAKATKPARRERARPVAPVEEDPSPEEAPAADTPGTRAAAIEAALRTGEVYEWRDAGGTDRGYVVAGAPEVEGGRTCRAMSVLTRSAAGVDRVDQSRECRPTVAEG